MKNLLKYASLLFAAAMLFACEKPGDGEEGVFVLSSDKNVIQTFDGDYATLTVSLDGESITDDIIFYDGNMNMIEITGMKFQTTKSGEYKIIANYGTYISEAITIAAVDVKIPQTPADPQPEKTGFKARVLAMEFTQVGCIYCPGMKSLLHGAMENETVADRVVLTACHTGQPINTKDPAYIRTELDDMLNVGNPPYLNCDSYYDTGLYPDWGANTMIEKLNALYENKKDAAAGIAVTSVLSEGQLVVKATVKAAEYGEYSVAAFLLEDGIFGLQHSATATWMHVHDAVIRHIDPAPRYNAVFYGHSLGKLQAGSTADRIFAWDLNNIWTEGSKLSRTDGHEAWGNVKTDDNKEFFDNGMVETKGQDEFAAGKDLHLAVFVCSVGKNLSGKEAVYVNNVVDCPLNVELPFEYR